MTVSVFGYRRARGNFFRPAHKAIILSLVSVNEVRRPSFRTLEGSKLQEIESGIVLRVRRQSTLHSKDKGILSGIISQSTTGIHLRLRKVSDPALN